MKPAIKTGTILGTGTAINVELGWIPTFVQLYQGDSLLVTSAFLSWAVPFTSGGATGTGVAYNQVVAGSTIKGVTSNARANVKEVLLASGAWATATGDAAGFFILEEGSLVGTFQTETIQVTNASTLSATNDASVTANVVYNAALAGTFSAPGTAATQIARYEGTAAGYSKGFTIGATLSVTGALLRFAAFRENT